MMIRISISIAADCKIIKRIHPTTVRRFNARTIGASPAIMVATHRVDQSIIGGGLG